MIKIALILNINGKSRYFRCYDETCLKEEDESKVIKEIYQKLKGRKILDCNIIEDLECLKEGYKVIYKKWATLFFVFVIDEGENELAIIDLIQNWIKLLEKNFPGVWEYHLVFNPDLLYSIMDEVLLDGMVTEINLTDLHDNVQLLYKE